MRKHGKQRHAASEALIALRTAMDMNQAQFAVMVLKTAVTTVARYETSHPPQGDLLLQLGEIAAQYKLLHLTDVFKRLYFTDAKRKLGFDLMTTTKTATEPAHGCLMLDLVGGDAIAGAQSFMLTLAQLSSNDLEVKRRAVAALASLQAAARKFENPAVAELQDVATYLATGESAPSTKKTKRSK